MNSNQRIQVVYLLLVLYAGLVSGEDLGAVQAQKQSEEIQQCRRNLHLIYEAIQAYRGVHKDLPNELAELVPHFLSEVHLVCPASRRFGLTSIDLARWGPSGPSSYTYEFTPLGVPAIIAGGSPRCMREWKELQMGLIGSEVPIVRCLTHERATLNLSFAGRIFESQYLDWENSFASVVDPQNLILARCLTSCAVVKKLVVPKRSAQALPAMIDLSSHYNVMLDESWPSCEPLRPFASMPSGIVEIDKTSFDIRGAVQLGALSPGLVPYPSAVTNIAIGLPGHQVHLLLATVLPARPDTPTAECVFHLADGRCQRQQLRYGAHLATCVGRPGEPVPALHEGKVAWSNALSDGGTAQLYQCGWTNPAPEQRIQSMDFVALDGNAGPLLVAVSVE